jgi:ubiquinone/menaquinone biosynthesis C-methylase UbiE
MTKVYDQKTLWITKWEHDKIKAVNNYARRAYSEIEKHGNCNTLLDLGCGAGQDAVYFARKGLQVTAADFSESGLRFVPKDIKNLKSLCLDIADLQMKNESFDVIYAHLSLHYFDDIATTKIFEKLHSVLKKGGLIFVKCKSIDDALYGVGEYIEPDMYCKDNHMRHFFSKGYMREKLQ